MQQRADKAKPPRRALSDEMERVLREGIEGDPGRAEMKVVTSMRNRGWNERQVREALLDSRNRAGYLVRREARAKGQPAARHRVRNLIEHADAFIAAHPPLESRHEAVALLVEFRAAADRTPWPGRGGSTDRKVLEALLRLAERGGGPVFRGSERQVEEQANVSRNTVRASLRRLQASGWLVHTAKGTVERGTTWTLRVPTNATAPVPLQGEGLTIGAVTFATLVAHDASAAGCLGATGMRVLSLLLSSEDRLTASEMAGRLGVSVKTVRVWLRRIESAGLGVVAEDRTWLPVAVDAETVLARLDRVAARTDYDGIQEHRREQHAVERQKFEDDYYDAKRRKAMKVVQGQRPDVAARPVVPVEARRAGA